MQDAVKVVQDLPGLQAVLLNCCAPQVRQLLFLRMLAMPHLDVVSDTSTQTFMLCMRTMSHACTHSSAKLHVL